MEEGLLSLRFERREFDGVKDLVFKGMRMTEDVAYKIAYLIGELCSIDCVQLEFQDEDGVFVCSCKPSDIYGCNDDIGDEEIEDNNIID